MYHFVAELVNFRNIDCQDLLISIQGITVLSLSYFMKLKKQVLPFDLFYVMSIHAICLQVNRQL